MEYGMLILGAAAMWAALALPWERWAQQATERLLDTRPGQSVVYWLACRKIEAHMRDLRKERRAYDRKMRKEGW